MFDGDHVNSGASLPDTEEIEPAADLDKLEVKSGSVAAHIDQSFAENVELAHLLLVGRCVRDMRQSGSRSEVTELGD